MSRPFVLLVVIISVTAVLFFVPVAVADIDVSMETTAAAFVSMALAWIAVVYLRFS